jgi:hypothetical protein
MIDRLVFGKWQRFVAAVNRRGRRVNEMGDMRMAASFEDVTERDDVVAQIRIRIDKRIANTRLRCEMHDAIEVAVAEELRGCAFVGEIEAFKRKFGAIGKRAEPRFLQPHVVIRLEVVDAGHLRARVKQRFGDVHADESGGAGDQNALTGKT